MASEHNLLCSFWISLVRDFVGRYFSSLAKVDGTFGRHVLQIYLSSTFARFPTSAIMVPLAY